MKKRIDTPCYIKCLAFIYGITMLIILFGRRSYDIGKPYWEQVKMNINLMPFRTISSYLYILIKRSNKYLIFNAFLNLFGNIAAFIPMGIFLSGLSRTARKILPFILWSTLIIIGIECIQLFTLRGSCDIDDLFLNLFGAMLGKLTLHIYGKVHKSNSL